MTTNTPDRFLRLDAVLERTGLSRTTLYRKVDSGTFPPQIARRALRRLARVRRLGLDAKPDVILGERLKRKQTKSVSSEVNAIFR